MLKPPHHLLDIGHLLVPQRIFHCDTEAPPEQPGLLLDHRAQGVSFGAQFIHTVDPENDKTPSDQR
jgi:hypothetical protein